MAENSVQSIDRVLTLIELLSDHEQGLGITEISKKTDLHKSTVHRLLSTLIQKGYVMKLQDTGKYRITMKLYELGSKLVDKMDILEVARPYLKTLSDITGEVVHMVVREGLDIIYVDKVEYEQTIRMHSRIGKRSPMVSTSVGKAIMALLPWDEVEYIWNHSDIKVLTPKTIIKLEDMKTELKQIQKQGFAFDEEENELGVRCVGTAIPPGQGQPLVAFSISGPSDRFTREKAEIMGPKIVEIKNKIMQEMGY